MVIVSEFWRTKLKKELNIFESKECAWKSKDSIGKKLKKLNVLIDQLTSRRGQILISISKCDSEVEKNCNGRKESLNNELLSIDNEIDSLSLRARCVKDECCVAKSKAMKLNKMHRKIVSEILPLKSKIANQIGLQSKSLYDFSARVDSTGNIYIRYCNVNAGDIERHQIILSSDGRTTYLREYSPLEREIHGWCDHNLSFDSPMRYK